MKSKVVNAVYSSVIVALVCAAIFGALNLWKGSLTAQDLPVQVPAHEKDPIYDRDRNLIREQLKQNRDTIGEMQGTLQAVDRTVTAQQAILERIEGKLP